MLGTKIEYLYRDAANYKSWGWISVSGKLSLEQLKPLLFDHEYFIPDAVGMKRLAPSMITADDHELHEFVEFVEIQTDECELSAEQLITRFQYAAEKGWFECL